MENFLGEFLLLCAVVLASVALVVVGVHFFARMEKEYRYAKTVCPIWTETLNALLDSDSPISKNTGETVTIAGVRMYLDGRRSEAGERTDTHQKVDRATQKRLREHLARKDAIEILKRAEATNPKPAGGE